MMLGFSLVALLSPAMGCGGHKAGTATGVDEPPEELSAEQEAAERENMRKAQGR